MYREIPAFAGMTSEGKNVDLKIGLLVNLSQNLGQHRLAALVYIVPSGDKIASIPGVSHVATLVRPIHQERDFVIWVFLELGRQTPAQVAQIVTVHEHNVVVILVVARRHLACRFPGAINPVRGKHAASRRVNGVPNFFMTNSAIGLRQMFPWHTNRILIFIRRKIVFLCS